jgi:hypothetical protein
MTALTEEQARAVVAAAGCRLVVVPYSPALRNPTHVAMRSPMGETLGLGDSPAACARSLRKQLAIDADAYRRTADYLRERANAAEAKAAEAETMRNAVERAAGGAL